jgi:hypothetical protein
MYEPENTVSHLAPTHENYDLANRDHMARMYFRASMQGINTFFDMARFRLSPLRRSNVSASNSGAAYVGHGVYNPALIGKLITILRFYGKEYIYCVTTRAMIR